MASHMGRTRSQVPVLDGALPALTDSPLKVARRALREDASQSSQPVPSSSLTNNFKRSASPNALRNDSKRAKLSHSPKPASEPSPSKHSRSGSDPLSSRTSSIQHSAVRGASPSLSTSEIPFIDLSNPPLSPNKQPQSPSKPSHAPAGPDITMANGSNTVVRGQPLPVAEHPSTLPIHSGQPTTPMRKLPVHQAISMSPLTPLVDTPLPPHFLRGPKPIVPSRLRDAVQPSPSTSCSSFPDPSQLPPPTTAAHEKASTPLSSTSAEIQASKPLLKNGTVMKGKSKAKSSIASLASSSSVKKAAIQQKLPFKPIPQARMRMKQNSAKAPPRIIEEPEDNQPMGTSSASLPRSIPTTESCVSDVPNSQALEANASLPPSSSIPILSPAKEAPSKPQILPPDDRSLEAPESSKVRPYGALSSEGTNLPTEVAQLRRSTRVTSKRKADPEAHEESTTPPKRPRTVTPEPVQEGSSPSQSNAQTPKKRQLMSQPRSPSKTHFSQPTASSLAKATPKSPVKPQTPRSPSKIARSVSLAARPLGRTGMGGSSLSDLTSALAKLNRPPPSRPTTSLGFTQTTPTSGPSSRGSQDDAGINVPSSKPGFARSMISSDGLQSTQSDPRPIPSGQRKQIFPPSLPSKSSTNSVQQLGVSRLHVRPSHKVSQPPTLPSVMGSPVKGDRMQDDPIPIEASSNPDGTSSVLVENSDPADSAGTSGRASHLFRTLAHMASAAAQAAPPPPLPKKRFGMGPPSTPPRRSTRQASRSSIPTDSSTDGSAATSQQLSKKVSGHPNVGPRDTGKRKDNTPSLSILKDCVIFVDVKGEDGRDAGELFCDMLRKLGARILNSIGTTCTHVIYKDGMASTVTRYRLMDEPKPQVVGISWVVECAERQIHADEKKHLIDVEDLGTLAGRRRKSAIPKVTSAFDDTIPRPVEQDVTSDIGNDSIDSSTSCDDGLTPLEKARRRRMNVA